MQYDSSERRHYHKETVASGATSAAVIVPVGVNPTVAIQPASTGLVQYTIDTQAAVVALTATWLDWEPGAVTENTGQVVDGTITALRCTATGGTCEFEVVAALPAAR